jgi:hypothetical protein
MENGTELRAMQVAVGAQEGQAEVAASAETTDNQVSAEMAVETPAPEVTTPEPEVTPPTEPAAEAAPVVETPTPTTPLTSEPYNFWPDLDQRTEGLIKDEDSLTALLQKGKEYEAIVAEKEEIQKNAFKPANDYIAKLNEMTLAGANTDQIKAFVKLNGYGDLDQLSPIDLKVTKMVLTEGYSEEIARKLVTRQYDLNQFDETDPDQKDEADIMREQLRIEAKKDLEILNNYKKELTVVQNPEKDNAEKAQLKTIAETATYNQTVEAEAPRIAKHFPEKLNYEFKVGDETVPYEDSFDKQFLENDLAGYVKEYFKDSLDPVNAETVSQAYSFALGEYLKANDAKRLEKAYQKGFNAGAEKTVNKYENRSGLPRAEENQVVATTETGLADFTKKMVGRT